MKQSCSGPPRFHKSQAGCHPESQLFHGLSGVVEKFSCSNCLIEEKRATDLLKIESVVGHWPLVVGPSPWALILANDQRPTANDAFRLFIHSNPQNPWRLLVSKEKRRSD
jgi:hypothetical protein